ncbi:MAG: HrpJ domain-containing protein [Parachlamydiaceae bacterium]
MADINLRGASDHINVTLQAMQAEAADTAQELRAEQKSSELAFRDQLSETVNPMAARLAKKEKPIKAQQSRVQKMLQSGDKLGRMLPVEQMKQMADQFQKRNPELNANTLMLLRESIKPEDSKEEILRKLLEHFPDISLADEALEFLLETTEGELANKIREVKEELNQERGREIAAGRNIHAQAREASQKGLGTTTSMRELYRDVTGNPREAPTLFDELSQKYAFKDLKKVVDFLLHSLGADMKSKGPSIEPGELHRLFTETRSLQAILGVYRYFKGRMKLLKTLFENNGIPVPEDLNFEKMAKEFMSLASERYPSADKVLQRAVRLGLEKWLQAKIIALSQFRDGVREMAMAKIYKSLQHRDDLYLAILEALEDLEDELDRETEESEEEEEGEAEEQEQQGRK